MSVTFSLGADAFRMDVFPLPASASTGANPAPLDIAIGGGRAWLSCEFARHVFSVPLAATDGTEMDAHLVPVPSPLAFRSTLFGDLPTDCTHFEDVDYDPAGNVWFTQMGQNNYGGCEDNRSRVLRYTPATDSWRAYPLPWNGSAACGLLVDGQRVWTGGYAPNGSLSVMRPLTWSDADTDAAAFPIVHRDEFGGYRRIDHDGAGVAHMAVGPDGRLYVTNYLSHTVTAYDRKTLAAQTYPLPSGCERPWQIIFDAGGGCWVTCDTTRQLAKLNPATGNWNVYATGVPAGENLHSLAMSAGVFWFTAYGASTGRIGRRLTNGTMELSPDLASLGFPKGATGIAIDTTGCIWVALFGSKVIGRLVKL